MKAKILVPLGVLLLFGLLVGFLWKGLSLNPRLVPSPLVGKPVPAFDLPGLPNASARLKQADLVGRPSLLNVWATWCVGCREEHGLLVEIASKSGVPLYGLNYKDQYKPAVDWLSRFGNPYVASGYDAEGTVGLDLGVYGLPETFVLDRNGTIAHKHVGPLTQEIWKRDIEPLLAELSQ